MKLLDEVTEAYYGSKGEAFARKTRERIHWICSKAQGETVLDVGCSQGITEVILAREGKKAVGIDIEPEAIEYAKNAIKSQNSTVQSNVRYEACSIFDFDTENQFDTIILSEVLEHFSSSTALLERVSGLMKQDGVLIVTVPFGINDYIDHKKTYYFFNLIDDLAPHFSVFEVKFFGKWIGVVAEKGNGTKTKIDMIRIVKDLENSFYNIERDLVDTLDIKTNQITKLNEQYRGTQSSIQELKHDNLKKKEEIAQYKNDIAQYKEDISSLKEEIARYKNETDQIKKSNQSLSDENSKLKEKLSRMETDISIKELQPNKSDELIQEKNQLILERMKSEEETLMKYKDTIFRYNQLEAKYANVSKKYELLSNAKLGRLTLKYWKYKKRIPADF